MCSRHRAWECIPFNCRPTDCHRYSEKATSIYVENSSTSQDRSDNPYSSHAAGCEHFVTPGLRALAGCQATHHVCKSRFPGWHFICTLGAVLAFVAAAILLRTCRLVSCKHMGHRNLFVPIWKCNYYRLVIRDRDMESALVG